MNWPISINRLTAVALACMAASTVSAGNSLYDVPMRWTDDHGDSVSLDRWKGKTVFITMAYSTCSRTCLLSVKKLQEFQATMDRRKQSVEVVVVSYDPKNDTPRTWAAYRQKNGLARDNWHFLTGDEQGTRRLSHLLGLADYWSYDGHLLHDFKISILDASGSIVKQVEWQDLHNPDLL